ncbi:MAG TPA: FHA domain-containing protein [Blastocatellia bacterium]|nr:FHA domain-containing protein [Blastocatellia bacterium]
MKLDLVPPGHGRQSFFQPPSAVESEPPPITNEAPPIAPPSFTTSTSIPKPAMPARERRNDARRAEPPAPLPPTPGNNSNRRPTATDERAGYNSRPAEPYAPPPEPPRPGGQTFALSSRGRTDEMLPDGNNSALMDNPRVTARLVVERGGRVGREFAITAIETNIGRWDADSGIFPDIDLDEDDPEAKISRRHARIINHNGQYFIEDLGSTNGTFVNRGRRLLPGKRQVLQNGDEIIVGKTFLKFQVLR